MSRCELDVQTDTTLKSVQAGNVKSGSVQRKHFQSAVEGARRLKMKIEDREDKCGLS